LGGGTALEDLASKDLLLDPAESSPSGSTGGYATGGYATGGSADRWLVDDAHLDVHVARGGTPAGDRGFDGGQVPVLASYSDISVSAASAVGEVVECLGDVGGDPDNVALDPGGLGKDAHLAELADDVVGCGLREPCCLLDDC
jgi:hypothetical protein